MFEKPRFLPLEPSASIKPYLKTIFPFNQYTFQTDMFVLEGPLYQFFFYVWPMTPDNDTDLQTSF